MPHDWKTDILLRPRFLAFDLKSGLQIDDSSLDGFEPGVARFVNFGSGADLLATCLASGEHGPRRTRLVAPTRPPRCFW